MRVNPWVAAFLFLMAVLVGAFVVIVERRARKTTDTTDTGGEG